MRPRIYVDTSVLGGCLDPEFREHSLALVREFAEGRASMLLSTLTLLELRQAQAPVRAMLDEVPEDNIEPLELSDEAAELAEGYLADSIVPERMRADAQHIAIATVARADVLVSWNFRHVVNLQRIHGFNSVNLRFGYPLLEIRSPREVIGSD